MGRNGKEMKNLFKNYHMYSNIYILKLSKFIEILTENKKHTINYVPGINIAPMASKKLCFWIYLHFIVICSVKSC